MAISKSEESQQLYMLFFPFMAAGHIIPMVHMAALFASRGARATVLTTPGNAELVRSYTTGPGRQHVDLLLIPFPSAEVGLPDGLETLPEDQSEDLIKFFDAIELLQGPFQRVVREHKPACVVSDMFLHWTAASAAALGVPRLTFHGMGFAALCTMHAIDRCVRSTGGEFPPGTQEGFVEISGLPRRVELRRDQLQHTIALRDWFGELTYKVLESERASYGTVVNSFYELEPVYADHYSAALGIRAWHVGPLRWPGAPEKEGNERCLAWLDSKPANSVVYACFGSTFRPHTAQLHEIVRGLEASGYHYIWVSRDEDWLPEGFEEKSARGLVMRGWAPQVAILEHRATGAFLSHCGWNSVLEAVCAGVPLITWPIYGDQLDNQRLVVDDLRAGVRVGPEAWGYREDGAPMASVEEVARAVAQIMDGGEEAVGIRKRMEELREMAKRTVEEGGSSHMGVGRLIDEVGRPREGRNSREWFGNTESS